jgi:hypothetical protein
LHQDSLAAKAFVKQTALGIFGSEQGIDFVRYKAVLYFPRTVSDHGSIRFFLDHRTHPTEDTDLGGGVGEVNDVIALQ